jgi:hypothetical protein
MYRGFELDIKDWNISSCHSQGIKVFEYFKPMVMPVLDTYLKENEALDGDKMRDNWFQQVDADIFISHSHADKDLAISLAGWLYTNFKLKAFIDSMIWGYADELLESIDKVYCKNKTNDNYNYKLRNYSTSHVHIMLATALTKMIDKSECFFFLNTGKSITIEKSITDPLTYSPWIYIELEISRLVRKKELSEYRNKISKNKMFSENENKMINECLQISYKVDLEHLSKLNKDDFIVWLQLNNEEKLQYPLGHLYELKPFKKLQILKS